MHQPSKENMPGQSSQGFTLIEVLISVAILAIVIIGMLAVYSHVIVEIRRAKNRTLATNIAQAIMETIVSSPYDATLYDDESMTHRPPPVRDDILAWHATLDTFPTQAVGSISAKSYNECMHTLCIDTVNIDIEIRYNDYGLERTNTLSLTIEAR